MPGTSTIALLWPTRAKQWPPEIDLFETKGSPVSYSASLHYGTTRKNYVVARTSRVRMRQGGSLHRDLEGTAHPDLRERQGGGHDRGNAHVPRIPMRFDVQTQAVRPHPTIGTTVVDWIVEYAPTR